MFGQGKINKKQWHLFYFFYFKEADNSSCSNSFIVGSDLILQFTISACVNEHKFLYILKPYFLNCYLLLFIIAYVYLYVCILNVSAYLSVYVWVYAYYNVYVWMYILKWLNASLLAHHLPRGPSAPSESIYASVYMCVYMRVYGCT